MLSARSAWRKSCLCRVRREGKKEEEGGEGGQTHLHSIAASISALSLKSLVPDLLPLKTFLFMMVVTHPAVAFLS